MHTAGKSHQLSSTHSKFVKFKYPSYAPFVILSMGLMEHQELTSLFLSGKYILFDAASSK